MFARKFSYFAKIVLFLGSHIGYNDGGDDGDKGVDGDKDIGDGDHEDDVDGDDEIGDVNHEDDGDDDVEEKALFLEASASIGHFRSLTDCLRISACS